MTPVIASVAGRIPFCRKTLTMASRRESKRRRKTNPPSSETAPTGRKDYRQRRLRGQEIMLRRGWKLSAPKAAPRRSEEHTSELQSLMRLSYAVFCLKQKKKKQLQITPNDN